MHSVSWCKCVYYVYMYMYVTHTQVHVAFYQSYHFCRTRSDVPVLESPWSNVGNGGLKHSDATTNGVLQEKAKVLAGIQMYMYIK